MVKKRSKSTIDIGKGQKRIRATGWASIILASALAFAIIVILLYYTNII